MNFRDKLKDIFYRVAGSNFPNARRYFYESKARESFNTAMDLMNGGVLPPKNIDKVKAFLNRKYEASPQQGPESAIKYFRDAKKFVERTEMITSSEDYYSPYYYEIFGISQEEFKCEMYEAEFQVEHPELRKAAKKNDHEFHP